MEDDHRFQCLLFLLAWCFVYKARRAALLPTESQNSVGMNRYGHQKKLLAYDFFNGWVGVAFFVFCNLNCGISW
ncbi:TonB-dependent receptor [Pseudomonas sp. S36]|nr:TonB-dependent receptor [Pseudomonas sp. S36]